MAKLSLNSMLKAGADKAQCVVQSSEKQEFTVEAGQMKLLRTTFDSNVDITAYQNNRKGSARTNDCSENAISKAGTEAVEFAKSSPPDEANDISEYQEATNFKRGLDKPDLDLMHQRLAEFLHEVKKEFPITILELAITDFVKSNKVFLNSNDVKFDSESGHYNFVAMFTSKEGKKASSFNYSSFALADLDMEFMKLGLVKQLLRQSEEQITTQNLPEKFTGDIIVTPDCIGFFLYMICGYLSDGPMISGTSIYKDSLNEQIASAKLTLHSRTLADAIVAGYDFTGDGFKADNSTIIDQGILKTFLLSLYGANKTGRERAVNGGRCFVVEPGSAAYEDIIKSTEQGLLLCRFSGGMPSAKGDFSGVAKNSYYIKDGKIQYPVSETMVSGNLAEVIKKIKGISRERINFGNAILPWISCGGVTVSGK